MKREFQETRIRTTHFQSARCTSVSPPIEGTKMTERCWKDSEHSGEHHSLTGRVWS